MTESRHLHIIGICGTAMAGLASLARDGGWQVTGSDAGVYPPMSTFLQERGITTYEGFRPENLNPVPDLVLVGNAISRGNPELEALMDLDIPYRSGAEWLFQHLLEGRHPIVVAGTHGKTTTTSIIAWLWEHAGEEPGFFIGGIPLNFGQGVRYPKRDWVVVEGDEYDTAFWDKRPKFLHYRPRTLVFHNLEFDHADIYPDLEAICTQFRFLLRTVPPSGLILANGDDSEVECVVRESFTPIVRYGLDGDFPFTARLDKEDGSHWTLIRDGEPLFSVQWKLLGRHNVINALAASAAALSHGLSPEKIKSALELFEGVARRFQLRYEINGISVYDDFAHHPTAVATTLAAIGAAGRGRIWAVLEPRSNTMRRRVHQGRLAPALAQADRVLLARPKARGLPDEELLDVEEVADRINSGGTQSAVVVEDAGEAIEILQKQLEPGDQVVVMSNGGFDDILGKLHDTLSQANNGDGGS
ncbi:MAG: UDP-N-acetylmuramate:L-alanyl-gamma-D-glutamyl-meso-diaminopimelate ligase [Magnetococcales bacterium]|nr:UDP-N-acetylmuramate:L-alanyl-gamma-D-glutamyl-meso-diaminopimelate ligase [Magnetococcales bacterium]